MKLRNKKTGMIGEAGYISTTDGTIIVNNIDDLDEWYDYNSLAELNEEWEDYEESKTFWYMTAWGDVKEYSQDQFAIKQKQAIGNYFETEEEAEKAVKKLKAWKRLKEAGFRTYDICQSPTGMVIHFDVDWKIRGVVDDLDLLFGGEE